MERTDVKTILKSYQSALRYWQLCAKQLDGIREIGPRSPRMTGMPRSSTRPAGLEMQIERILAAEERLEKAREKALEIMDRVEDMVDTLEDHDQKRVIRLRYIDGLTWEQLARETHWSERTVYRIHGAALEELRRTHGWME